MKFFVNFCDSCVPIVWILILTVVSCKQEDATQSTSQPQRATIVQEQHRPQYHFTPQANWMNDPNGMFYYNGIYHLFYQYYPDSTVWGPMHWGHAQSTDLVHWDHLPVALYPDSLGYIFSGGAVVDIDNTSGLGQGDVPPVIATFTHHDPIGAQEETNDYQSQSVAYSLDGGENWEKYDQNPVIPNHDNIKDFRDPKVVWHEQTKQWILVLAAYDKVKFYASNNLLEWRHLSDFGIEGDDRLWECPDFFQMQVEGTDETKWVLIVSIAKQAPNGGTGSSYFIGDFDGQSFTADTENQKWLDYGTDHYAFVTWNNAPKNDDRIIGIAWMSNWVYAQEVPTETWRSAMTLPRELRLVATDHDYQLYSTPVTEINKLRGQSSQWKNISFNGSRDVDSTSFRSQEELNMSVDLNRTNAQKFGVKLENDVGEFYSIIFDRNDNKMYVDRRSSSIEKFNTDFYEGLHSAYVNLDTESLDLKIYFDVSSAEIFVNDGELAFTSIYFPTTVFDKISIFSIDGSMVVDQLFLYDLQAF